ncbi:hypothetical protein F7S34_00660 [Salmonella enterica]|uniref:Uncharacterized protein n=1 Tax=Salmonella enterica TaxID=28901 RepID=A0A5T2TSK1_SALER|nr:hypothetical protein [Salmonella enterica]EBG5048280.1 hypothetical protein [Salmonella enterica subsp. enterica serovar Rissen]ECI2381287.1 hypothetical protein [Salmonella enterica subsp. enterica serovar Senftenberg]EDB6921539.1 hypothetical protein [Salmonella enterica subsp. enterica serovar Virchow]EDN3142833.1 hypothetical protein [Salmonella enterica subsp. enterica serovar Tennessee]EDT4016228.1 hypothetical protein [Salmonella enterica subsp. enterica]EEN6946531.1 hypothetical pr
MLWCSAALTVVPDTVRNTAADKRIAHTLRIITSHFSAIKKAPFLAPGLGFKHSADTDTSCGFFHNDHKQIADSR